MRRKLLVAGGVLAALVLVAVTAVYALSTARMRKVYALAAPTPPVPRDSAAIARGRHIARSVGSCTSCHGERLEGRLLTSSPAIGALWPVNLTSGRGGVGGTLTDAQWERAIRHGVGPDGRTLLMMPAEAYQVMSDEDVGDLIAYLKQLPPVDHEVPKSYMGPLARALILAGKVPFLTAEQVHHDRRPPARVERAVTPEYGYYLARLGGCIGCHGSALSGRKVPGAPPETPPAANLTPTGIGHYSDADFIRALHEGKRPDGSPIDSAMPLRATRELTSDEARAILAYLKTVPPREFGQR